MKYMNNKGIFGFGSSAIAAANALRRPKSATTLDMNGDNRMTNGNFGIIGAGLATS